MGSPSAFGRLLRAWRRARRFSQERLALEADVSPRHLSCVETGRSQPSREMVLLLSQVLEVPLRERNALLTAAGFAPVYRETDYDAPEMGPLRRALELILLRHEPYAAFVVDSAWNVKQANAAAGRLLATFLPGWAPGSFDNLLRLLFQPEGLREVLDDWEEVARISIQRTYWDAAAQGPAGPAARILEEVLALPGVPRDFHRVRVEEPLPLILPMTLRSGDHVARLFTTITTLGTPADLTAQEIRVETLFPADETTEAWYRAGS